MSYQLKTTVNLMEMSLSWEAASHSATQEYPNIIWNMKIHYNVQKSLGPYSEPD
jgi:hypothetical protein